MGKWRNGKYAESGIEPIAQRINSVEVSVRRGGGKKQSVPAAEYFIEQTLLDAINGDVQCHKEVVKWAQTHLLPVKRKEFLPSKRRTITQEDIDLWAAEGVLPRGCVPILERMNLADMNRAYRAYKRKHPTSRFSEMSGQQWKEFLVKFVTKIREKLTSQ